MKKKRAKEKKAKKQIQLQNQPQGKSSDAIPPIDSFNHLGLDALIIRQSFCLAACLRLSRKRTSDRC
jgi:hypothetical protein